MTVDVIWLIVLGLVLGGWFVLDGFTLGTGMLLSRLGRDEGERRTVLAGVGPFFLAGEVWLVAAAGVLIAAFPELENTVFTAFHPLFVLLLVCWVVRSASLWFRNRRDDASWRRLWGRLLAVAGAGFAASWGLVLGNLVQGVPAEGEHVGLLSLLDPSALLAAAAVVVVLALHGAVFTAARTPGGLSGRAVVLARRLVTPALGLLALAAVGAGLSTDGVDSPPAGLLTVGAGAAAVAGSGVLLRRGATGGALVATSVAAAAPVLCVGLALGPALTALAAPDDTLGRLSGLLLPALGLVVLAQAWVLWLFRHRVDDRSIAFF